MLDNNKLILHPKTYHQLVDFIKNPTHALIISGPSHSGKKTLTYKIIENLLDIHDRRKITADKLLWQTPIKKQISIDQIRYAKKFAKVRQKGLKPKRFIVFENAESMAEPAQNALLKLLEEPSTGVIIILLIDNDLSLRPTIRSRARHLRIYKPEIDTIKSSIKHPEIDKIYSISDGRIGILKKLISQEPENISIDEAKQYLRMTVEDRLIKNSSISDRLYAIDFVSCIQIIIRAGLIGSLKNGQSKTSKAWLARYKNCLVCQDYIKGNANIRLSLDWLAVKLV